MISRINKIIDNSGLNAKEFAKKIGISNTKISDWRSGKTKPTVNDIIRISQIFDVSCDYVLTGNEPVNNIAEDEQELISLYRSLPSCVQREVLSYIKGSCAALSAVYSSEKTQKKQA